jgi:hypothetical protein
MTKSPDKQKKLAKALRDNLLRRKVQQRQREEAEQHENQPTKEEEKK